MALELYIPPCIAEPAHPLHLPPPEKPLRIQIDGPLTAIQRLLPGVSWNVERPISYPLSGGPDLARLTFQQIYGRPPRSEVALDMVVRDEYLGWVREVRPLEQIDYYGFTFDHLVPADDHDPEVLQINIAEMEYDNGAYANEYCLFTVDPAEYTGKKVLATPRCCQKRKGTQDRGRVNDSVGVRDGRISIESLVKRKKGTKKEETSQ